jgi:hypothetical protein
MPLFMDLHKGLDIKKAHSAAQEKYNVKFHQYLDIPEHTDPSIPVLRLASEVALKANFTCHSGRY